MAEHDDHTHDHSNHDGDAARWWYNHKTGEVEEGPKSLGSDRDGPFETREEAEHAPEIARARARAWAAEEDD